MKLYIIRHGETAANAKGMMQGWMDNPLNQQGIDLAAETGRAMTGIRFDAAYSSPLKRAYQTAEAVLQNSGNGDVTIQTDDRIKEISFGEWEGRCCRDANGAITEEKIVQFFRNPLDMGPFPGGESARAVCLRTEAFLRELGERYTGNENILVATHGVAVRAMLHFLYEDQQDFWHGHVPYNCAVNILEVSGGKFTLVDEDHIFYDRAKCVDHYEK